MSGVALSMEAVGDERAALMHKLIHTLWTMEIDDAEARGCGWEADKLRAHMQQRMPSLAEVNARRRVDAQIARLEAAEGLRRA